MKKIRKAVITEDENLRRVTTYPPEKESDLKVFRWPVYRKYVFSTAWAEENGSPVQKEFIEAEAFSKYRSINPFEHLFLYKELSKVQGREEVYEFACKYGLLTEKDREELNSFLLHAFELRQCLELYKALQDKDYPAMEKNLLGEMVKARVFHRGTLSQSVLESLARKAIVDHVNKHLAGARPFLHCDKGEFFPAYTCENLLEAIYLQVYEVIGERKNLVRCKECGSLFVPSRKGQRFCPRPEGMGAGTRSPCQNRYAVRKCRPNKGPRIHNDTL